jgi:hypothetical protein
MQWPTNLLDASYASSVLKAVTAGEHVLNWAALPVSTGGREIELLFSALPLRIDDVFINVSATLQQQVADLLGAMLPTPKIMDLAWLARAVKMAPVILPIASTSAAMVQASGKLDANLAQLGYQSGTATCQKTWAIGNSLLTHPGKAMNYGFAVIPNQPNNYYSGIATEACVSIPASQGRVIQGQGWAHDSSHLDYSQACYLVHRSCRVDGSDVDLATVLQDPTLAPLLSHEGVLQTLRQPGVSVYACAAPKAKAQQMRVQDLAAPGASTMCPTPPRPSNIETEQAPTWKYVAASGAALVATVGAFWLAMKYAGRAA